LFLATNLSPIGIRISILHGSVTGNAVYFETHLTQTNENGLLNIEIGEGSAVSGTYINGIFWGSGPYFIHTEIDPLGGTDYTIIGTSELLSVPFSNYSHVRGSLAGSSAKFIGSYLSLGGETGIEPTYLVITYLGMDKVQVTINGYRTSTFLQPHLGI